MYIAFPIEYNIRRSGPRQFLIVNVGWFFRNVGAILLQPLQFLLLWGIAILTIPMGYSPKSIISIVDKGLLRMRK